MKEETKIRCPRCKAEYVPDSIASIYVCKKCGAFMDRYEDDEDEETKTDE